MLTQFDQNSSSDMNHLRKWTMIMRNFLTCLGHIVVLVDYVPVDYDAM